MLENRGPIHDLALAAWLWLVPAAPLACALALLAMGVLWLRDREEQPNTPPPDATVAARLSLGAALTSLLVLASYGWTFATADDAQARSRVLVAHVVRMARIGQLDASLDLTLDRAACVAGAAATVAFALLVVARAWPKPGAKDPAAWRVHAWASLGLGGALLVVVADNLVVLVAGASMAATAAFALGGGASRYLVVAFAGAASALVAGAVVFWALGGSWSGTEYAPDLNPRYVAVSSAGIGDAALATPHDEDDDHDHGEGENGILKSRDAEQRRRATVHVDNEGKIQRTPDAETNALPLTGKGSLTMASQPGSLLYLDDSRTPMMNGNDPYHAPVAHVPMNGGIHSFRVHPGGGLDDYLVTHVPFGGGATVSLVLVGPTLGFREIADQLGLRNAKDEAWLADAFRAKHATDTVSAVALACWLVLAAALVWCAQGASPFAPLTALFGAWTVARLTPIFALTQGGGLAAAWGGAAFAALLGARALAAADEEKAFDFVASGAAALAVAAAGGGDASAWTVGCAIGGVALAAGAFRGAPAARPLARGAAAATLVPLAAAVEERGIGPFVLAVVAVALLAAGVLRPARRAAAGTTASAASANANARGASKRDRDRERAAAARDRALGRAGIATAAIAVVLAALASWSSHDLAPLAIAAVAAGSGRVLGARAPTPTPVERVAALEDTALVPLFRRLGAWVLEADAWVVDAVWSGIANLVHAGSWVHARIDDRVLDAPADAVAARTAFAIDAERAQKIAFAVVGLVIVAAGALFALSTR